MARRSLAEVFDPKANSLNFIRLVLAAGVIFWHAFPLSGAEVEFAPARQLMGQIWVDGFFAVSGFLIVGAWMRDPDWGRFLAARVLRIFPGYWTCLIITAFVLAPLSALIADGLWPWQSIGPSNATYVVSNAVLSINQTGIDGTLTDVPYPDAWNGSLWTLRWEFLCYLGVLVLGLTRLLTRRLVVPALFLLAVVGSVAARFVDVSFVQLDVVARFALMFLAGAVVYLYQSRIPVNWPIMAGCAVAVAATMLLPDYRVLGALPLAVLLLGVGALVKSPRLRFANDISYGVYVYAFPVQQILATLGVYRWGILPFALVGLACTIPLAAASWFIIEKQAMRLRPRKYAPKTVQELVVDENRYIK